MTDLLLGAVLGALHFGGLWATVQRAPASPNPAALLAGSLGIRLALLAAGLAWLALKGPAALALGLAGLLVAKGGALRWSCSSTG